MKLCIALPMNSVSLFNEKESFSFIKITNIAIKFEIVCMQTASPAMKALYILSQGRPADNDFAAKEK